MLSSDGRNMIHFWGRRLCTFVLGFLNIRAFIASIEYHYQVPAFVKESGDPRLMGVMEGILEAYISEKGWMGTHR